MFNKLNITYAKLFDDFKCISGECEDTCCQGWDIEIDKDSFMEYENLKDENIKAIIDKNVCKNDTCISDDLDYALIKLNSLKKCPFLDSCNYCIIHSKLGEKYLGNICTQFPRVINKVDHNYEISLDVACLEAARIMLSSKDKIEFTNGEKVFKKYFINDEYNTNSKKYKNSPIKYLKEIRDFSIKIIQNRNYDICERLYILGDFISNVGKKAEGNSKLILEVIEEYDISDVAKRYKKDNNNYIVNMKFFKIASDISKLYNDSIGEEFKKYTKILIDFINIDEGNSKYEDKYINLFKEYNKHIIDNAHIFENYLVNFMYGNLFPFSENDNLFDGYIILLVRYSFIRLYLVSNYVAFRKQSSEDIVKMISIFAREIEHDKSFIDKILGYIKENKYDNLDFVKKFI